MWIKLNIVRFCCLIGPLLLVSQTLSFSKECPQSEPPAFFIQEGTEDTKPTCPLFFSLCLLVFQMTDKFDIQVLTGFLHPHIVPMLHEGNLLKVKQETTELSKQTNTQKCKRPQKRSVECKKTSEGDQGKQSFTQKLQKTITRNPGPELWPGHWLLRWTAASLTTFFINSLVTFSQMESPDKKTSLFFQKCNVNLGLINCIVNDRYAQNSWNALSKLWFEIAWLLLFVFTNITMFLVLSWLNAQLDKTQNYTLNKRWPIRLAYGSCKGQCLHWFCMVFCQAVCSAFLICDVLSVSV